MTRDKPRRTRKTNPPTSPFQDTKRHRRPHKRIAELDETETRVDEKYVRWVRDQQFVEARYSCRNPERVPRTRTVIAFTDRPTVTSTPPGGAACPGSRISSWKPHCRPG